MRAPRGESLVLSPKDLLTMGPMLTDVFTELLKLEVSLRVHDDSGSETAEKAIRESFLNDLTPRLCAGLLASLCLDKAKASKTKS